jgi:hypothetical protein
MGLAEQQWDAELQAQYQALQTAQQLQIHSSLSELIPQDEVINAVIVEPKQLPEITSDELNKEDSGT